MNSDPKVNFDNLENAFASKSDAEINQAYLLFRAIAIPTLVKYGGKLAEFALEYHLPVKGLIRSTIFQQFLNIFAMIIYLKAQLHLIAYSVNPDCCKRTCNSLFLNPRFTDIGASFLTR